MKTGRILYALQYFKGDHAPAMELMRLIVDLTRHANAGQPSPHADFLFNPSHDAPMDMRDLRYAGRAFSNVLTFRGRDRASGWPAGPNAQAGEVYRYYLAKQQQGLWSYSGMMFGEADCVPLATDFIARIHREWSATDRLILGCVIGEFPRGNPDGSQTHVNGNLVISHKFSAMHPQFLMGKPALAWDAHSKNQIMPHAQASREIFSDYKLGSGENPWRGCDYLWRPIRYFDRHPLAGPAFQPSYLHGVKTPLGLACARERLLPVSATA